jgi:phosphohistidine phosphatase
MKGAGAFEDTVGVRAHSILHPAADGVDQLISTRRRRVQWALDSSSMQIYLLRHGIAEEARAGQKDADRALTPEGKEKLRRVLQHAGVNLGLILSSPYRRALETAGIAAEVLEYKGKIVQTEALIPEASPYAVWEEIRSRSAEPSVLLASHEPLMSSTVALLLGAPSLMVEMKKAALVRVDCDRLGRDPKCVLKWMLTPAIT